MLKIEVLRSQVQERLKQQKGHFRIREKDFILELGHAIEESGWALTRVAVSKYADHLGHALVYL